MTVVSTPNGMTVRELKEAVKDIDEVDSSGEEYEVWIEDRPGRSSQVKGIIALNQRETGSDILLFKTPV